MAYSLDMALLRILSWSNLDVLALFPWKRPDPRYLGLPSIAVVRLTLLSVLLKDVPHIALQARCVCVCVPLPL